MPLSSLVHLLLNIKSDKGGFVMLFLPLIAMVIIIELLFSMYLEKYSIIKSVINTENGIVRECELPFSPEDLMRKRLFFQPQIKHVGKVIISKTWKQFRNNLKWWVYLLGNNNRRFVHFLRHNPRCVYSRC